MKLTIRSKLMRSRPYLVSVSLLAVLIIGITDYRTDTEISLVIFYLLPIVFVAWFAGRNEGLALSVLAATISLISDVSLAGSLYSHPAIPYWNGAMRGFVFVILVLLSSRLKVALFREKQTSRVKSDMLALVGHLNLAMTSNLDFHSVVKSLLEAIEVFFPGCALTIRLLNRESGDLELLTSGRLDDQEWKTDTSNRPADPEIFEIRTPRIVRNGQTEPRTWNSEFCRRNGLVSYLSFPLIAKGEFIGIISLYTKCDHEFTKEEISFFSTLAGQAAIALENTQLFEEVRTGHQHLRDLSRRLLEVQETDRRQLATELHDEIGQSLTGLKLTLEMAGRANFQSMNVSLAKAQALIDDLIGRVRGLSLDLRPSLLDDLGLLPTLFWHLERYTSTTGVKVNFDHYGVDGKRFEPQVETAAYRIVQEALTNVARHARVDHARVSVWWTPNTLIIEIQDDGVGFDYETAMRAGKSIGLDGMRERTILLRGKLNIEAAPGSATCIIAELPSGEPREDATRRCSG